MVNVTVDQIVQVILSDEKLLQYALKVVNKKLKKSSIAGESEMNSLIDHSIDKVFKDLDVLEIVRNTLFMQNRFQAPLQPKLQPCRQNDKTIINESNASASDEDFRPSFSLSEPIAVANNSPKRVLKSMNKSNLPAFSEPNIPQPIVTGNNESVKLSIEIEPTNDDLLHHALSNNHSFVSVAPSEASTVRMTITNAPSSTNSGVSDSVEGAQVYTPSPSDTPPVAPLSALPSNTGENEHMDEIDEDYENDDVRDWEKQILSQLRSDPSLLDEEEDEGEEGSSPPTPHTPLSSSPNLPLDSIYKPLQTRSSSDSPLPASPVYFDVQSYTASIDALQSHRPVRHVHFTQEMVTAIHYRDIYTFEDKQVLFFSHEEESKWAILQGREFEEAERRGMSWYDFILSTSEDELEEIENEVTSEMERDFDEYDRGGYLSQNRGEEQYEEDYEYNSSFSSPAHSPHSSPPHSHPHSTSYPAYPLHKEEVVVEFGGDSPSSSPKEEESFEDLEEYLDYEEAAVEEVVEMGEELEEEAGIEGLLEEKKVEVRVG